MAFTFSTGRDALRSALTSRVWFYSFLLSNIPNGGSSPLIPLFLVAAFSGTVFQVGLVTAATSIASIPAFIIWGNLSDKLHRRKFFIVEGFVGLAVSLILMLLSVDFAVFLAANFILGLLYTASAPAGTALVIEQTERENWTKVLGIFSRISGAGYLLGLVAGGMWFMLMPSGVTSIRHFMILLAVIALISAASALLLVREGNGEHTHRNDSHWNSIAHIPLMVSERAKYVPARIGAVIKLGHHTRKRHAEIGRNLWIYYITTVVLNTGFVSFYAVLPNFLNDYLGERYGIGESTVFMVYIGSSVVSTLSYGFVSNFSKRMGEKKLQTVAAAARVAIIPSFFFLPLLIHSSPLDIAGLVYLNCLMGFCWAIISVTGQSMVAAMAGEHIKGEAMGIYNASFGAGSIIGALAGGYIAEVSGYLQDFMFSSISVGAGVCLLATVRYEASLYERKERRRFRAVHYLSSIQRGQP